MTQRAYDLLMQEFARVRDECLLKQQVCAWCGECYTNGHDLAVHIVEKHPTDVDGVRR